MLENRIIELKNGTSYYVLDEIEIKGKKYILAAKCNEKTDEIDEENFIVKEIAFVNGNVVTRSIENDKLAAEITKLLLEKVRK